MPDRVELYSSSISHYCVSAERMLAFKGIRWRARYAAYDDREELRRRTGQDYVPALLWNGRFVRWDRIPAFLDRLRPSPRLLPRGREALATALENWGHQVVEERVWRAVVTRVPPRLRSDRERWVFEEMQSRARGPWEVLRARRATFERELEPYFALVDRMLTGRRWLLDEPSVADFGVYGALSPWWTVGSRTPPSYRRLDAWAARIRGLGRAPRRPAARTAKERGVRA